MILSYDVRYAIRGAVYLKLKNKRSAMRDLQRGLSLDPQDEAVKLLLEQLSPPKPKQEATTKTQPTV